MATLEDLAHHTHTLARPAAGEEAVAQAIAADVELTLEGRIARQEFDIVTVSCWHVMLLPFVSRERHH
jgi:hypothetical protein